MTVELLNCDCMEYMASQPDNSFDLVIADPPYGIGESGKHNKSRVKTAQSSKSYKNTRGTIIRATDYKPFSGDDLTPPETTYFRELERVSRNQIIFGANHFADRICKPSPCWLVWDKNNSGDFADCELAYTSFKTAVRKFTFTWNGMLQGDMKNREKRIHPTQKPVKLYQWILDNYAKPEHRILDTHLGSGSSAIACHYYGCDFVGCEIDEHYFNLTQERFRNETKQLSMI